MTYKPDEDVIKARFEFTLELLSDSFIDASWLYEQRLSFFTKADYLWVDFDSCETRLTNFLEALINRDDSVETFCLEHAFDGEAGDIFVAMFVLAKRKGVAGVHSLISDVNVADSAIRQAVVDAVNLSLTEADTLTLAEQFFTNNTPDMLEMAAQISGHNRLAMSDKLIASLQQVMAAENPNEYEPLIHSILVALGKLMPLSVPAAHDLDFLYTLFEQPHSDALLSQLAITLLKAKHPKILNHCVGKFNDQVWPIVPLGLYGHSGANGALWQLLNTGTPEQVHQALLALGLLGNPDSIDVCIQCLAFPNFAESAANALQIITGADLYKDVFIPDEIDPDELFPDELERYEKGEPVYPQGEEPGETITQVVQDAETWRQWREEHQAQFKTEQRYRYGNVISKTSLLNLLKAEKTPHTMRALIIDELAIQYGVDVKIEPSMFVNQQLATIERELTQ